MLTVLKSTSSLIPRSGCIASLYYDGSERHPARDDVPHQKVELCRRRVRRL